MNMIDPASFERPSPAVPARDMARQHVEAAVTAACRRIAPLWPLKNFVAVNPFLGFADRPFAATTAYLMRVARTRMLMPRGFYREAMAKGEIGDAALAAALARHPTLAHTVSNVARLRAAAAEGPSARDRQSAVVATIAEILDRMAGGDRNVSLVSFMLDEISSFCAAYFDEGQAIWRMPLRRMTPYAAWRAQIRYDRNPEIMGITGFRSTVLALPSDPMSAIAAVVSHLGIPERAIEDYLLRALFDIGGWSAYARYIGWQAELEGRQDDTLVELLAIRVAWGLGLFEARSDAAFRDAWAAAMVAAADLPRDECIGADRDLAVDLLLHQAYEIAVHENVLSKLKTSPASAAPRVPQRPPVQAAFCIDVRSEVFRRALETAYPEVETIGFAGFFGFPIEYVPIGQERGGAHCPVLLKPSFTVCEGVAGAHPTEEAEVLGLRLLRRRAKKVWKSFKLSAVSSFTYVETIGLGFLGKLVSDSAGLTRPVPSPSTDGLDVHVAGRVGPRLEPRLLAGRETGFSADQRIAMAEAVLKAMSMTGPFARLVLLAGHGSTSVNNPHATSLDCGACGGHTGEANARVAAAILNDTAVREGLIARGIEIPQDCRFLAALHDTTTDEVRIFDTAEVPAEFATELARLERALERAGAIARLERSALLGSDDPGKSGAAVVARSRDWSQVRPEWGLAGNSAFVAAPRRLTRNLDFRGRTFLHSYDHEQDAGYGVLELIMTAPMVVASWINLQYFGSTVNNAAFGSGNKVLHNVVGQIGVLEGNAGDLRVGLPWQSVHDGKQIVHEPVRLSVFIAAPEPAMDAVLAKHPGVRDLVVNQWIFLHALGADGSRIRRCLAPGQWVAA